MTTKNNAGKIGLYYPQPPQLLPQKFRSLWITVLSVLFPYSSFKCRPLLISMLVKWKAQRSMRTCLQHDKIALQIYPIRSRSPCQVAPQMAASCENLRLEFLPPRHSKPRGWVPTGGAKAKVGIARGYIVFNYSATEKLAGSFKVSSIWQRYSEYSGELGNWSKPKPWESDCVFTEPSVSFLFRASS